MSQEVATDGSTDVGEGYKQVQLGPKTVEIPEEWDVVKLDDITTNSGEYGASASAEEFDLNEFRYIRITDISENGNLKDDEKRSIPIEGNEKYKLTEGDLLFARTGAVGRTYLYSDEDTNVPCAFASYLIRFDLLDEISSRFLKHYTNSYYFEAWVESTSRSTTHANINAAEYSTLDIPYPPLSEQRFIAEILSIADTKIQQTKEIIATTEKFRLGLMQDLLFDGINHEFFQEVQAGPKRFSIPEKWDLSNIGEITTRLRNGIAEKQNHEGVGIPVTRIETIADGFVDTDAIGWMDLSPEEYQDFKLEKGDILFSHKNSLEHLGKTGQFWLDKELYHGENLLLLRPDRNLVDPQFVYFFLNTRTMRDICESFAKKSVNQVSLNQQEVSSLPVPIPPMEEQKRISSILVQVEEKLQEEKNRKQHLHELKRGLMQDLLTGKVRVNPDNATGEE